MVAGGPRVPLAPAHRDPDAAMLEQLQALDTKFEAEPVVPAWAMEKEQMIAATFSPEALKTAAAPAPLSHEESCRSKTCPHQRGLQERDRCAGGAAQLLGAISSSLSHTTGAAIPGADGSVQIVMYARAGTPSRSN
jgi:hypothetical protein